MSRADVGRSQPTRSRRARGRHRRVSLCETLDRVLNKGAVIAGDVIISVAGVDLVYLGVNLVVTSVETMRDWDAGRRRSEESQGGPQRAAVSRPAASAAAQV